MIVLIAEMWPQGDESKKKEYARAYIANDAKTSIETSGEYGSYNVRFMQNVLFDPKKVWRSGKAKNIHRQKRGLWDILYVALRDAGCEERNPKRRDE